MSGSVVAVSAPGKVLFAGGYLVLDRQYTGLVFGLDARIHVHVRRDPSDDPSKNRIVVASAQFGAVWAYKISTENGRVGVHPEPSNESSNHFVQTTLQYALTYIHHLPSLSGSGDPSSALSGTFNITILADDDYYSTKPTLRRPGKFTNFGIPLSEAHKTGLGSSAALVTALTAALLITFIPPPSTEIPQALQKRIHNLAQAAHCAAQGKVGSGFDVAAAVYGSCLYRRFTPAILESVGDASSEGFGERLHRCVEDLETNHAWDVEVLKDAVCVPESLRLVMCDVDCGSQTPGMVKRVLNWRKERPEEAALLWGTLQRGQEDLCMELRRLSRLDRLTGQMGGQLQDSRRMSVGEDETFGELKDVIQTIRSLMREMSEKSGVPIEPRVLTELLDACSEVPGVIGGFCPGAGGYDAVAVLVKNDEAVVQDLRSTLAGWKSGTEAPSGPVIGKVNLLDVKQDVEGLRVEDPSKYHEWDGAISGVAAEAHRGHYAQVGRSPTTARPPLQ